VPLGVRAVEDLASRIKRSALINKKNKKRVRGLGHETAAVRYTHTYSLTHTYLIARERAPLRSMDAHTHTHTHTHKYIHTHT